MRVSRLRAPMARALSASARLGLREREALG